MARKGVLDRVTQGVYIIRPLRALGQPWGLSSFIAVEQALGETPHYIGALAALTMHRLTDQSFSSVVDVYLAKRLRSRKMGNAMVRFHAVPDVRLQVGSSRLELEERPVWVSDPEKTLLDALDYPAPYGSLEGAVRTVDHAIAKVDAATLVRYGLELSSVSTLQRLGVLLERHGAQADTLKPLERRLRKTRNEPSMVSGPRVGRLNQRWRIVENDLVGGRLPETTFTT